MIKLEKSFWEEDKYQKWQSSSRHSGISMRVYVEVSIELSRALENKVKDSFIMLFEVRL